VSRDPTKFTRKGDLPAEIERVAASVPDPAETRLSPGVEPGTVLAGKFKVERVINSGGMGIILVAHHLQLHQRVAIKVLRAHVLDDPEVVARFAREARVAAKIKSEHVVRVIDVGSLPNGFPYMVMEHLEGSDLSALLKARGPLPCEEVVEYVLQACEALAEAHIAGVVHRDLKPANLFLTRRADGSPLLKVLDFGISKVTEAFDVDSAMTKTSMIMGSPQYMSPEQLKSARNVDGRADIWAIGVVLYRLIANRNPFHADSTPELCVEILHGDPTPIRDLVPAVPEGLANAIARCLKKKPADRFQSIAELARALAPFAPERAKATVGRIAGIYENGPRPSLPSSSRDERDTERDNSETDAGARTMSGSITASVSDSTPRRRRSRAPLLIGIGAVAAVVSFAGVQLVRDMRAAPSAPPVAAASTPAAPTPEPKELPVPSASATISATPNVADASVVARPKPSVVVRPAPSATASASIKPGASAPPNDFGGPY
jgi:serine/threonine-protein kinase